MGLRWAPAVSLVTACAALGEYARCYEAGKVEMELNAKCDGIMECAPNYCYFIVWHRVAPFFWIFSLNLDPKRSFFGAFWLLRQER